MAKSTWSKGDIVYVKIPANMGLIGIYESSDIEEYYTLSSCYEVYTTLLPVEPNKLGTLYAINSPSDKLFDLGRIKALYAIKIPEKSPLGKIYLQMKAEAAGIHLAGPSDIPPGNA